MLRYDPLASLRADGEGLLAAAERAGLDAPVPWCPGWNVRELVFHVAEVWDFWAFVVDRTVTDPAAFADYADPVPPPDAELVPWARDRLAFLWRVLGWANQTTPLWTWAATEGSVAWVRRRMAQETAVHRWDAEAAAGADWRVDALVAADGIDEFLQFFSAPAEGAEPVGGTVHIHCTDDDVPHGAGEWMIHEVTAEGARFDREHAKGDCAVRGPAGDLLLWVWRRPASVEVIGDAAVAARFAASARLT
jgi:uncharacterized protein (TIGR03083 family)